jgi:hypothetical protein
MNIQTKPENLLILPEFVVVLKTPRLIAKTGLIEGILP